MKLKNNSKTTLSVIGAAALMVVSSTLISTKVEARELVYGSWMSAKSSTNTLGMPPYFEAIKRDTNGEIDWKLIGGGQLANGKGTIDAVKNGMMDAGVAMAPYTPKELPATNMLFNYAVMGDDSLAAAAAMNEVLMLNCSQCQDEYEKNGAVGMIGYSTSPYLLMCRDKIETVAELKGRKVRASGGGVEIIKMFEATPVAMSPAEATTALERGALDCVMGPVYWLRNFGYMDVAKHVLVHPLGMGGPPIMMYINRDVWLSMTPAQRKTHIDHAPLLIAEEMFEAQIAFDISVQEESLKNGVTFRKGGNDFAAVMEARQKELRSSVLAVANEHGVRDAEALLEAYDRAITKWYGLMQEIGPDKAKYQDAIWREIYSKVDPENL